MFCADANETIIVIEFTLKEIIGVSGNQMVGLIIFCLGRLAGVSWDLLHMFDDLLIKKSLRRCNLVGSFRFGKRLPNSTYTESLGMLQRGEADLYLRGQPDTLHEDWLHKSVPIAMEDVVLGQIIHDHTMATYFNLLDNFNVGISLSATYLLSFFLILATAFLLDELTHRIRFGRRRSGKISKRIALAWSKFRVKISKQSLSAIGLFVLFVHWFLWITEHLLTNNISTNNVVVDTSHLIKDTHDILTTKRVACVPGDDQLASMISSSPTKNILSKVFFEKTRILRKDMVKYRKLFPDGRCMFARDSRMISLMHSPMFAFGPRTTGHIFLVTSINVLEGFFSELWYNEKAFFEYTLVLYYSLRKSSNKQKIPRSIMLYCEAGLFIKLYSGFNEELERIRRTTPSVTINRNVEDYVERHSAYSDMALDNFRYIFIYYGLFCSLVLATFCAHHLSKFTRKGTKGRRNVSK